MPFDQVDLTEVQLILLGAANEVRKGWCQRALERDGNVCLLGALHVAGGAARDSDSIFNHGWPEAEYGALKLIEKHLGMMAVDWNNAWGRTAEGVASALEAAAFMEN